MHWIGNAATGKLLEGVRDAAWPLWVNTYNVPTVELYTDDVPANATRVHDVLDKLSPGAVDEQGRSKYYIRLVPTVALMEVENWAPRRPPIP